MKALLAFHVQVHMSCVCHALSKGTNEMIENLLITSASS